MSTLERIFTTEAQREAEVGEGAETGLPSPIGLGGVRLGGVGLNGIGLNGIRARFA